MWLRDYKETKFGAQKQLYPKGVSPSSEVFIPQTPKYFIFVQR